MSETTAILLAAGQSQRMGQPKQLLLHHNKPLIRYTLDEILGTGVKQVLVVLGAFHEAISPVIQDLSVKLIVNPKWETGMAGSIQCGLREMDRLWPDSSAAMICLTDQALLKSKHYQKLLTTAERQPNRIVASSYQGILGAPALFPKQHQNGLLQLKADQGAGKWLRSIPHEVIAVELPEAAHDWDRPEDLPIS